MGLGQSRSGWRREDDRWAVKGVYGPAGTVHNQRPPKLGIERNKTRTSRAASSPKTSLIHVRFDVTEVSAQSVPGRLLRRSSSRGTLLETWY